MIYVEVQFIQLYQKAPLYHEIAQFLTTHGFKLHNLSIIIYNQNEQLAWGDALFLSQKTVSV